MKAKDIDEFNKYFVKAERTPNDDIMMPCAFVGNLNDWKKFSSEKTKNKEEVEWASRDDFILKNGESWRWISRYGQMRGYFVRKIVLPRWLDIDDEEVDSVFYYMRYCVDVEWYGKADDEL